MNTNRASVVFFDIGDTLGTAIVAHPDFHLERIDVYAYIPTILQQLTASGIKIGIISNTGNETAASMKRVLESADIYHFFQPELLIYSSVVGFNKPSPEIFRIAATAANQTTKPQHCLFVGEDDKERKAARNCGFQVVPHPMLVGDVLNGNRLRYIRVGVTAAQSDLAWRAAMRDLAVVPLYVTGEHGDRVYAIATTTAITQLDDLGFEVDRLGSEGDPLTTEVYLR